MYEYRDVRKYRVPIEYTLVIERRVEVEARSRKEAIENAREIADNAIGAPLEPEMFEEFWENVDLESAELARLEAIEVVNSEDDDESEAT